MYPSFPFFGFGRISSYFLVISFAFIVAIIWLRARAKRTGFNEIILYDLSLRIMLGGFLGARLFHVVYELPFFYLENPWEILKFWKGGFVFYGGFFASLVWGWIFLRQKGESPRRWLNLFAPVLPLGYFLGRFATLLSGSGYGKPTDLPWGIVFPPGSEAPPGIPLHPTQIYAMLVELFILFIVLSLEKRMNSKEKRTELNQNQLADGNVFFQFLILHAMGRIFVEFSRDDYRGRFLFGGSVSTWISLFLILWAGFELWILKKNQEKVFKPFS